MENVGQMSKYRNELPQLAGGLFLNDAGLETDIIFNKGVEIREFAAHTLLPDPTSNLFPRDVVAREIKRRWIRPRLSYVESPHALGR